MAETPNDTMQAQIDALLKKVALLEKVSDKAKLARLNTPEEHGMDIRIPLYRASIMDEPKLVKSWKMTNNEVRVTKYGEEANQTVEIELWEEGSLEKPDLRGLKMQLGAAKSRANEEKVAELTKKIEDAEKAYSNYVDMDYADFGRVVAGETVKVEGTEERNGLKFFIFTWKGKEYKLAHTFINP